MIIAWAFFIVGATFASILFLAIAMGIDKKPTDVANFWLWFIVAVGSAQYIWG